MILVKVLCVIAWGRSSLEMNTAPPADSCDPGYKVIGFLDAIFTLLLGRVEWMQKFQLTSNIETQEK